MITRLRAAISRQLSRPEGRAGRVVAALMNRGNSDMNNRAIDLLGVGAGDRVLDLGFGGALTFPTLLDRGAIVVGVDRSQDMVDAAARRHGDAVTVLQGDIAALPLGDDEIDAILTVNTVYFWPDLPVAFGELHRVLKPGGRLVIGIRDGSVMEQVTPGIFTIRTPGALEDALRAAGFGEVATDTAADGKTHLLTALA